MSNEFIPKETSDWQSLQESLTRTVNALSDDEFKIVEITRSWNDEEGIKLTEKYLKDNFESISQAQKDFLLVSLRIKNYRLQHKLS